MGHMGICKLPMLEDYGLCKTPFCRFLLGLRLTHVGLTWEGSPVVSQRSYGGHFERSTCVQSLLAGF